MYSLSNIGTYLEFFAEYSSEALWLYRFVY